MNSYVSWLDTYVARVWPYGPTEIHTPPRVLPGFEPSSSKRFKRQTDTVILDSPSLCFCLPPFASNRFPSKLQLFLNSTVDSQDLIAVVAGSSTIVVTDPVVVAIACSSTIVVIVPYLLVPAPAVTVLRIPQESKIPSEAEGFGSQLHIAPRPTTLREVSSGRR